MIGNNHLLNSEKAWLEHMLSTEFLYRDTIIHQIENAEVEREYTDYYIFIKFQIGKDFLPMNVPVRVPVEMRVFKFNEQPVQFLLHIISGYVHELEVFRADSSLIGKNFDIMPEDVVEVILDKSVQL